MLRVVIAVVLVGSACACTTTPDCTRSVAEACAADYSCVTQWPEDPAALCVIPAATLSTQDCGAYHVLDASQGDSGGTRYYYAVDTGALEAIVSWDPARQIEGCQGGPSDLVVSRCSGTGTPIPCSTADAGAGGSGG
jgi:hypothetical protein